jgi:hypothetical protein
MKATGSQPWPDETPASCSLSGKQVCPGDTNHSGNFTGDLKSNLVRFAFGAGRFTEPVFECAAPHVSDNLGGYMIEPDWLIAWFAVHEIDMVDCASVLGSE